jgi:hypothetical protein
MGLSLSFSEKAALLFRNVLSWFGTLFAFSGIFGVIAAIPVTDVDHSQFAYNTLLATQGVVRGIETPDSTDGEAPVQAIYYHYDDGQRRLYGRSYSSTLQVKAGQLVPVEYVANQPEYSRIVGARRAPQPASNLLFINLFTITGLAIAYIGIRRTNLLLAILADYRIVNGLKTHVSEEKSSDSGLTYDVTYSYEIDGKSYNHVFDTGSPKEFKLSEQLAVQHSLPHNAVLVANLSKHIRRKITTAKQGSYDMQ